MIHPDSHNHIGPLVLHHNDTIVYADAAVLSLLRADSRDAVLDSSLLEYVSSTDQQALSAQFDRIENQEAESLGCALTINVRNRVNEKVIAVSTRVKWDGDNRIQTVFIPIDSERPTGVSERTLNATPTGISIADATATDLPLIYVNDEFIELTGYSRDEVLGRNCRFLQGEETREEPVQQMRQALDDVEPVTVELRNYRKDGSMFWNRVSLQPVTDTKGELTTFLGFQEDISARKAYEQEKSLFEMQADSIEKSVFITDAEGTIVYVNQQFEQKTGYQASEAIGENPRILKSGEEGDAFYEDLWETITAGDMWEATLTNKRKTGERYTVEQKILPIKNEKGELTHYVAIEEDVTDEEFTEEIIDVMNRVLRHNLRNSVSVIRGYAQMLEEEADDSKRDAGLQTIQEHAEKLEKISSKSKDIRELFRQRHDHSTLSVDQMADFIQKQQANFPDAKFESRIRINEERNIESAALIRIAIEEAIENAVLHNDRDHPHIEITISESPVEDEVQIEIADDGPGIPRDQWDVIVSGQETPLNHGDGIGLWLIYWAITAMGGTLKLTENDPRGSIIHYAVPIKNSD